MKLSELKQRSEVKGNGKLAAAYAQFEKLLNELAKKGLPDEIIPSINEAIDALNSITESGKTLKHQIRKKQSAIIKLVEKRLKIVPKNYYQKSLAIARNGCFWHSTGCRIWSQVLTTWLFWA
jgi:polyhydroxyalkanoate synthesis regulator phasin